MRREIPAWVVLLVGVLVAVPIVVAFPHLLAPTVMGVPGHGPIVNASLVIESPLGSHPANPFFAVVFTSVNRSTPSLLAAGAYLNTTPVSVFRFGGGGEGYDPTTQTDYLPPPTGGSYFALHVALWNFTWFHSWCSSRPVPCTWLSYLPAEENDTRAALHWAMWFHQVLGFAPTYWQFGNEPEAWTHYGENYTNWSTLDSRPPSALDYATMVRNYISVVSTLYPQDRFVGIESACDVCQSSMTAETAALNGAQLSAMAFHSYPSASGSSSLLSQFYGALTGPTNVSLGTARFRGLVAPSCSACPNVPIQIGEYQAGPVPVRSPFASGYPGAAFIAASIIQALAANVSSFTLYDIGALQDPATGALSPEGLLYQQILENIAMGRDTGVQVKAPGVGGAYSVLIQNGSRQSLLIVNTNPSFWLNLSVNTTQFPVGSAGSVWNWDPSFSAPHAEIGVVLPSTYLVPSQGILLLANY